MKLTRTTRTAGWLAVAGLLGAALIAPTAAFAVTGPEVTPTLHDGNIQVDDCPVGVGIYADAQDTSGSADGVTVTIVYNADDKTTDFEATGGVVLHAFIKGGDAYNDYDYTGLGGVTEDDGLVAPIAGQSGEPANLSHAIFCVDETVESETTTTTTTTTQATTQSTTTQSTTTQSTTTTRTGSVQSETGGPTPPSTDTEAFTPTSTTTGSGWSLLLVAAAGLLAAVLLLTPATAARKR